MKTLLTISPEKQAKIANLAQLRGIPFATLCRALIYEKIQELENVPAVAAKQATSTTKTPHKDVMAHE